MGALVVVILIVIFAIIVAAKGIRTVPQAHVAVVTKFGKYSRTLQPGLSVVNPFTAKVAMTIPVQNRTKSLQFAAITEDQASVHFTATIIYTVAASDAATIQLVAFKFIDQDSFDTALSSAVEASVREFVAGKKQAEVLGLRQSIVDHAKHTLDDQLASWGYLLVDLTVNDITFDPEVMKSMSRVVSAKNAQTAAEYEGEALLIARTKQAEAEGKAQVIAAQNGAEAARLRGEGIAAQRAAIADGLTESGLKLAEAGIDVSMLAFSMWTESLRDVAVNGKGNTIFLDGSLGSMEETLRRTNAFIVKTEPTRAPKPLSDHFHDAVRSRASETEEEVREAGDLLSFQPEAAAVAPSADLRDALNTVADQAKASAAQARERVSHASEDALSEGVEQMLNAASGAARQVAAGWYADPQNAGFLRFWDGQKWTGDLRGA